MGGQEKKRKREKEKGEERRGDHIEHKFGSVRLHGESGRDVKISHDPGTGEFA